MLHVLSTRFDCSICFLAKATKSMLPTSHVLTDCPNEKLCIRLQIVTRNCTKILSLSINNLKSLPVSDAIYPPGALLHLDFSFCDTESIRGFASVLDAVRVSSSFPRAFLVRSKQSLILIMLQLINYNKTESHPVYRIRVDKDGTLVHSSEFLRLMVKSGIAIETTTRHKSTSNIIVERIIRENHKLTRIVLLMSKLPLKLWCYAQ